jgi:hypothetical protein
MKGLKMFPIFVPPSDSEDTPDANRRRALGVMVGLGVAVFLAVSLLFIGRAGGSSIMPLIILIAILVIGVGFGVNLYSRDREKRKRKLDGLDMYSLIDRMVDDLDDDELAYLQRRLDEQHSAQDTAQSDLSEGKGDQRRHG